MRRVSTIFLFTCLVAITTANVTAQQRRSERPNGRNRRGAEPDYPLVNGVPVTGEVNRFTAPFDAVMLKYRDKIQCSAAALAISHRGRIVLARGYGWTDVEKTEPVLPSSIMGIASCEKPMTTAYVKRMGRGGSLNLDRGIFELLGIKPSGEVVDNRAHQVTIRHLLEHKAGWDQPTIDRANAEAGRVDGQREGLTEALSYLMTQRSTHDPGTTALYSNFGYDVLRHLIETSTSMKQTEAFRTHLFHGLERSPVNGIFAPEEVKEIEDAGFTKVHNLEAGGPVGASVLALCVCMKHFWITGEIRDKTNPKWVMNGSLDGSTSSMIQRSDGFDVAFIFNGRNDTTHLEIQNEIESLIERLR